MRGKNVRPNHYLAGLTLGLGLIGCTSIGFAPERSEQLTLNAPSEVVAWHLAALCRSAHPGLDPRPGSALAPVPIWSDTLGYFEIQLGGGGAAPMRISQNGRLPIPDLDADLSWRPRSFSPAARATGCGGPVLAELEIEPISDGRCRLSMSFYDEVMHSDLPDRLLRAALLLDSIGHCANHFATGQSTAGERRVELSLSALRDSGEIGLGRLEALLHLMRAERREAKGDLVATRLALRTAGSLLPDSDQLRRRIADLDQRLARPGDAEQGWRRIIARCADPDLRSSTEARLRDQHRLRVGRDEAEFAAAAARRMFARGDEAGGLSWARLARSRGGESTTMGQLDAHARALGDHRSAMAIGLARLREHGFRVAAIEQICEDALAAGQPAAALRLLAAHWEDLQQRRPELARELRDRAGRAAGPALTARVLSATRSRNLTGEALDRWHADADDSKFGARLLARVEGLRAEVAPDLPDSPPEQDGFELAPGVAPPR